MMLVTLSATLISPMLVDQNQYFTYAGFTNVFIFGLTYLLATYTRYRWWYRYLLIAGGYLAFLPLVFFSGGINSQFLVLFPIAPVIIAIVSNGRDAWIFTVAQIVLLGFLLQFTYHIADISNEVVSEYKTTSRAIWAILACVFSATFATFFDRTNRRLRLKLTAQAYQDVLTGIDNRRSIVEALETKVESGESGIALIMIDVDAFKNINDSFGHAIGDQCLIAVAQCLQNFVRGSLDQVGRYGGEEFLVLLNNIDRDKAIVAAEAIRKKIEALAITNAETIPIPITVTLGLHCADPRDQLSADDMLKQADLALYEGKSLGRNQVIVSDDLAANN